MLNEEQINKQVKLVVQEAWRVGTNTTINDTIEYCMKELLNQIIIPQLQELHDKLKNTEEYIVELVDETIEEYILNTSTEDKELEDKDNVDEYENGGVQEPQRGAKARVKSNGTGSRQNA